MIGRTRTTLDRVVTNASTEDLARLRLFDDATEPKSLLADEMGDKSSARGLGTNESMMVGISRSSTSFFDE